MHGHRAQTQEGRMSAEEGGNEGKTRVCNTLQNVELMEELQPPIYSMG